MLPMLKTLPLSSSLLSRPVRRAGVLGFILLVFLRPSSALAELNCLGLDGTLPAECQSFQFSSRILDLSDPTQLLGELAINQTIVGTFTINTAVRDVDFRATHGEYQNAFECVRFEFPDRELLIETPAVPVVGTGSSLIVLNDAPGGDVLVDAVEGLVGGGGTLTLDAEPFSSSLTGQGSAMFSYLESCPVSGPSSCVPLLNSDDAIPNAADAPGDLGSAFDTFLSADFFTLGVPESALATLQGELLSLDASPPIPCPEPGLGAMLSLGVLGLLNRRLRRPKAFRLAPGSHLAP